MLIETRRGPGRPPKPQPAAPTVELQQTTEPEQEATPLIVVTDADRLNSIAERIEQLRQAIRPDRLGYYRNTAWEYRHVYTVTRDAIADIQALLSERGVSL